MASLSAGELDDGTTKLKRSATSLFDCSRSLSHFSGSPNTLSSLARHTSSSPHISLRVLALVKGVCRRFAKRIQKQRGTQARGRKRVGRDVCRDLEREAYAEIDRYLGKRVVYPHFKNTKVEDRRVLEVRSALDILDILDNAISNQPNGLVALAKDHSAFIDRREEFALARLTLQELTSLFIEAKQLLSLLSEQSLVTGDEALVLSLDDLSISNLEHLLLCLLQVLLQSLASEAVAQPHRHLLDCQKDQSIHSEEWFFEYPNAQHPLSTTWPWSLRPSLAVLWGVCWMFPGESVHHFDDQWNAYDESGRCIIPGHIVREYRLHLIQSRPASAGPGAQNSWPDSQTQNMLMMPRQAGRSLMPDQQGFHFRPSQENTQNHHTTRPDRDSNLLPAATATPRRNSHQRAQNTNARAYSSQDTNTIGAAASNSPAAAWPDAGAAATWQPGNLPQSINPPSSRFNSSNHPFAYPGQPSQQSQSYLGFAPGLPQVNNPLWEGTSNQYSSNLYPTTAQSLNSMAEVAASMVSMTGHQTAPHMGGHSPHASNQQHEMDPALMGRKRSHGEMMDENMNQADHQRTALEMLHQEMESQTPVYPMPPDHVDYPQPAQQNGSPEQERNPQDSGQEEDQSDTPQRARTIRRGDPPRNAENQMICTFSEECAGEVFDRKCEWSKHMDKHDRPYKCVHPDCTTLQGFTYSGGLLRHEREVHKKHGGPKATLRCPVVDCKRHNGKGFTRKENLNEHVRRVHDGKVPEPPQRSTTLQDELESALAGAEQGAEQTTDPQLPTNMTYPDPSSDHYQVETAPMAKRQRTDDGSDDSSELEQLRLENARLRAENADQAARIRDMETREAVREARLAQLELFFGGIQQPTPGHQEDQDAADGKVDAGMA